MVAARKRIALQIAREIVMLSRWGSPFLESAALRVESMHRPFANCLSEAMLVSGVQWACKVQFSGVPAILHLARIELATFSV